MIVENAATLTVQRYSVDDGAHQFGRRGQLTSFFLKRLNDELLAFEAEMKEALNGESPLGPTFGPVGNGAYLETKEDRLLLVARFVEARP